MDEDFHSYADCTAKPLTELDKDIDAGLHQLNMMKEKRTLFKVYIKDGCNGW